MAVKELIMTVDEVMNKKGLELEKELQDLKEKISIRYLEEVRKRNTLQVGDVVSAHTYRKGAKYSYRGISHVEFVAFTTYRVPECHVFYILQRVKKDGSLGKSIVVNAIHHTFQ